MPFFYPSEPANAPESKEDMFSSEEPEEQDNAFGEEEEEYSSEHLESKEEEHENLVYLLVPQSGPGIAQDWTPFYHFGDDCGGFMYHVCVPNVGTPMHPKVALFPEEWTLLLGMEDPELMGEGYTRPDGRIVGGGSHFDVVFEPVGTFYGVMIVTLVPS